METGILEEIQAIAQRQASLCKVFSSAQRVLILWLLAEKERTVSEIASALGASLPCTSQHLHLMELKDILVSRRIKQNIYYGLADNDILKECLILENIPKEKMAKLLPYL
jgi:DNA-binding transcriptional ArsR family regulator